MKTFYLAIAILVCSSAYASYFQDNCWNSDSSVEWATGHSENSVKFQYFVDGDFGAHSAEFSHEELDITITHRKEFMGECGSEAEDNWSSCWYTVRMLIMPKPEAAARFKLINWLNGKFDEKMICQKIRG